MKDYARGLIAIWLVIVAGCANDAPDVTTLMAHGDCKELTTTVSEVRFEDLAGIRGSQLLISENQPGAPAAEATAPPPEPDFRLIAISAGTRPTAGFALELRSARFESESLILTIVLNEPPAGTHLAQVTSRPCLIIATSHLRVPIEVRNSDGVLGTLHAAGDPDAAGETSGQ